MMAILMAAGRAIMAVMVVLVVLMVLEVLTVGTAAVADSILALLMSAATVPGAEAASTRMLSVRSSAVSTSVCVSRVTRLSRTEHFNVDSVFQSVPARMVRSA
ncbi:hypothetical protein MAR_032286 [Mya arenaria]|uniref:Secreted protein n=1 Tax=Mya arenaria TaxID=6604 RepID=A0ABY7F676_MYAAR|nr:hypothetical protein MAR_032286 [Mya arenaria]